MTKRYCVMTFIWAPSHITKYVNADSEEEAKDIVEGELIRGGELDYDYIIPNIKYRVRQIKERKAA